ncbi:MAG: hypothetical protein JW776_14760 [Candidatus Lokiarchaeota archaeon]|nr:hypothetical protein [Candidatus Lokiarchaeota archaeon]
MNYNERIKFDLYQQFGNIFIFIGFISILRVVYIISFMIGYEFAILISSSYSLAYHIGIILLLSVNFRLFKSQPTDEKFKLYYQFFLIWGIIGISMTVVDFILGWTDSLDETMREMILLVLTIIMFLTNIFGIFVWVKLGQYGKTRLAPFGTIINIGSILLSICAGIGAFLSFIAIFYMMFGGDQNIDTIVGILSIFSYFSTAVLEIIGYLLVGINIKKSIIPTQQAPIRQISIPTQIYCINCSSKFLPNSEFCPKCGWSTRDL